VKQWRHQRSRRDSDIKVKWTQHWASSPESLPHFAISVKTIQIGHKFSQILTSEPHILIVNPCAKSIYGCVTSRGWMRVRGEGEGGMLAARVRTQASYLLHTRARAHRGRASRAAREHGRERPRADESKSPATQIFALGAQALRPFIRVRAPANRAGSAGPDRTSTGGSSRGKARTRASAPLCACEGRGVMCRCGWEMVGDRRESEGRGEGGS
jgi:hypothetical protein